MRYIVTGSNGTLGSALKAHLEKNKHEVIPWDRSKTPIDNYAEMEKFVKDQAPNGVFHLATASQPTGRENESWLVNYEWTSELAWITRTLNIPFLFTSSTLVFSDNNSGPFTLDAVPDAPEGYGCEKRMAEERVFYQNPNAVVARLGWQIGSEAGSNNMVDFIEREMQQHGSITASTKWLPACSLLEDTVTCLSKLIHKTPGLYMLDSNKGWSFYDIVCSLSDHLGKDWHVQAMSDYVFDQRMIDSRAKVTPLNKTLKGLATL